VDHPTTTTGAPRAGERDPFVDFVRAFSLIVVVVWHWAFTIIIWRDDGPHATNPIGFTHGLWLLTWLFQVLPLFFYIGGYSDLRAWERAQAEGRGIWSLVSTRLQRLAIPSLSLLAVWVVLGAVLGAVFNIEWVWRAVLLVVSPLWYVAVYLVLVLLLPVALWLHVRFGTTVLVFMAGFAGLVDITRFRDDHPWLGLANMILVWGLCHQLGFFYERIVAAPRQTDWTLLFGGLFALVGLVYSGLYPGSMVGVPGERSNMAPPTLCIVALVFFQAGVAEILRPSLTERLHRPAWARVNEVINRFSMPLFLFHTTGMAIALALGYALRGNKNDPVTPDARWWLTRPLALVFPLLFTLPVIWLFGRRWARQPRGAQPAAAG
jgi:Acyltransferase family